MTLIDNVKERANAQIDTQKSRATDTLGVIANAVRGTTEQLRNEQHDVIAQYIENAANQLDRVSATLRGKDANALLADARQLARRQPALFIGSSFVVGLLAARFLKSSARANGSRSGDYASDVRSNDARGLTGAAGDPRRSGLGAASGYGTTGSTTTATGPL
jgi:hypothetical protein